MAKSSKFESNVQYIKYLVNKEIAKRFFKGELESTLDSYRDIAESIIPGPKATFRCCIYKERHIIEERVKLAIEPTKDDRIINVLDSACDECPIDRFVVTEACRGCLGHKCEEICPRNAISVVNHRAYINQAMCIECGRCKEVCPFNAISEVKRPCTRACPVGAMKEDENRKAVIDHSKCVSCGACVYQCPFGAVVDKSFVLQALRLIRDSWSNTNYKVFAVVAPSIASQFPDYPLAKIIAAIKDLGFAEVVEAALGADMVALHEAREFAETIGELKWKTSSCCPAFVDYVQREYPEFMPHVSNTVSPMVAISAIIKERSPRAKVVFIGPCTAKKVEIKQKDIQGIVDAVITFEELRAMFDAKGIEAMELEDAEIGNASYFGRVFGRTGGMTEGVLQAVEVQGLDVEVKPVKCNGLDECIKAMKIASLGKLNGNFIEGMACKHGCTGGAASVTHDAKGIAEVNAYGKAAVTANSIEALKTHNIEGISIDRQYEGGQ